MDKAQQLERLRGAPPLVLWLTQQMGAWVVGSRADFHQDRVHKDSDWDILVPLAVWPSIGKALPLEHVRPTRHGGWRFESQGVVLDVFPMDIGDWLTNPYTRVAWHPQSGTIVTKVCEVEHG